MIHGPKKALWERAALAAHLLTSREFHNGAASAARSFFRSLKLPALLCAALFPTLALAQNAPVFDARSTAAQAARVAVSANADRGCFLGAPSATGFPLGVIIDQSGVNAGRLRTGIVGQAVTLPDSWCNFADNALTLTASPMSTVDGPSTPPAGFTRLVNFRATAANWQRSGASVIVSTTAAGNAPNGTAQASSRGQEAQYRVADLVGQLDQFVAAGTALGQSPLMVASKSYQGSVIVSLGPAILN